MDWGFSKLIEKADFNTLMATCVVVGWVMFFVCPNNIKILAFAFFTTVYCAIRLCVYFYKSNQAKNYAEIKMDQYKRHREKEREQEFAEAKYVYERLNNDSQNLLYDITQMAIKGPKEGSYILKGKYDYYMIIQKFYNLINNDYTVAEWIEYDDSGDSFSMIVTPPLNKLIEKEII